VGYFSVPCNKDCKSPSVNFRLRAFVEPASAYLPRDNNIKPEAYSGKVVRLSFGRQSPGWAAHGYTPLPPKSGESKPDEMMVFATLMNGYGELISKLQPVAIFSEAQPDDKLQARGVIYHKLFDIVTKKYGYVKTTNSGPVQIAYRKDVFKNFPS
jgi:hypothetical protein